MCKNVALEAGPLAGLQKLVRFKSKPITWQVLHSAAQSVLHRNKVRTHKHHDATLQTMLQKLHNDSNVEPRLHTLCPMSNKH